MEIKEVDFAVIGLLIALTTIYYGPFTGEIWKAFWLAPLLTILTLFACYLLIRPIEYAKLDLPVYLVTIVVLISIAFLGSLDITHSLYLYSYLAFAFVCTFFAYYGLREVPKKVRSFNLRDLDWVRPIMILFIILSCLICYLYFDRIIWNWGSDEGEINIKAFQTLLQGTSPYSKTYLMEYGFGSGNIFPYSYFPVTLLYYGLFSTLPTSPVVSDFNFSGLRAGTMIITILTAILLLKSFKTLKHESFGRFLAVLFVFVFGFSYGGVDSIHLLTVFFITLTTYCLISGKYQIGLLFAGLTALTQPIGSLFSIFALAFLFRKLPRLKYGWKNVIWLVPSVALLLPFVFWDFSGFINSIFGYWTGFQGGVAGTYFASSSVANFTYFFSPMINLVGGTAFFVAKIGLMLVLGGILLLRYSDTITKAIFSSTVFILAWLFFVNSGISILYLQEVVVITMLFAGLLMVNNRRT